MNWVRERFVFAVQCPRFTESNIPIMYDSISPSLHKALLEAQQGNVEARERLAEWMIEQVEAKVGSVLGQTPASISRSSLVSNVLMKLVRGDTIQRAPHIYYLFSAIVRATREILIDHWRQRERRKKGKVTGARRGDKWFRRFDEMDWDLIELNDAINVLETIDPRKAAVVTLRFFLEMPVAEVALRLGVSKSTVESDWGLARAWLFEHLKKDP